MRGAGQTRESGRPLNCERDEQGANGAYQHWLTDRVPVTPFAP
jgi:hypothetical protein